MGNLSKIIVLFLAMHVWSSAMDLGSPRREEEGRSTHLHECTFRHCSWYGCGRVVDDTSELRNLEI